MCSVIQSVLPRYRHVYGKPVKGTVYMKFGVIRKGSACVIFAKKENLTVSVICHNENDVQTVVSLQCINEYLQMIVLING